MRKIGFHAPHERFSPRRLLDCVAMADKAGFAEAMCSDHFHPWGEQQGESGFAWSWLGAALERTKLSFGTVSAPGQRYHPAILAQAIATLNQMYPERLWVALGSGQFLNEGITGQVWPSKRERNSRLLECVQVMRALWAGETVNYHGRIVVEEATLYTRPPKQPVVFCPALTTETARWGGSWADGLLTGAAEPGRMRMMIEAFSEGGGAGKPVGVQAGFLIADDKQKGMEEAKTNWGTNVLGAKLQGELRLPSQFDAAAKFVQTKDMLQSVQVSTSAAEFADYLNEQFEAGVARVFVHFVSCEQERSIEWFAEKVLPQFR
ncbi:MAG: TIGR03885 family FMN-dependent LLM class oxidoreductase [Verrucomicrobiales bacterium]